MKTTKGWNITWNFILAYIVFNLVWRSKSRGFSKSDGIVNNITTFPVKTNSTDESEVAAANQDFVVKFKNESVSLKNLLKLLRQHNITVPQEERFLDAVIRANRSSYLSCEHRCFLEERSEAKWCYCDKDCKTWGDCCLDFRSRCGKTRSTVSDSTLDNMTCGDVNDPSWTLGVIMKSSCSLPPNNQNADKCQTVQQPNMTLQKEMPLFDLNNNVTYRSVACTRCNHIEGNLSFWGLDIKCPRSMAHLLNAVTAPFRFLKENAANCSWKYAPLSFLKQRVKSCVVQDSVCVSNKLPVMSVVRELCSSYSMVFFVVNEFGKFVYYRNPHCALCNPEGRQDDVTMFAPPSLSILFDVSSNILPDEKELKSSQSAFFEEGAVTGSNLGSLVYNCSSFMKNCTVTVAGKACVLLTSLMNQTTQMPLNTSRVKVLTPKQLLLDKSAMKPEENTVVLLCPDHQTVKYEQHGFSVVLSYMTFTGTILSIVSLCFLLSVYLSFKELRNLPGKCLISLSCALLCYQVIFLSVEKSKEVGALCKAVAISIHFFVLAAFSWMSVMAFDTANTFKVQLRNRGIQASRMSDIKKTFIKYCIVGWGVPAVAVVGCAVLDSTGTFHFGYGNNFYCWISDKTAIAVAMVTPVSLALVFNAMCLTKTLYVIHHLQQGAKLAGTNTSRVPFLVICIKLTAVMGLTWILALIANLQQVAFLKYPSAVLNSMQGLFIMLCFTTTKRVRGLLKEKVCKRCNHAESNTTCVTHCKGRAETVVATCSSSFNMTTQPTHGNYAGQHTP